MKSKYCVRLMRPTFHRAILMVEARSEEEAVRAALRRANHLSEAEWTQIKTDKEQSVVEIVLPVEEEDGNSEAELIEYVHDVRHAYALLRADLKEAEGTLIVPTWLKDLPELATADITQDWCDAVSGVCGEEAEAFYAWLIRQGRQSNIVDFFAERDKRCGRSSDDQDAGN